MDKIVPALGVVTSTLIFFSPLSSIRQSSQHFSFQTTNLNPIPFPMMLNNASIWILYSFLVGNSFIFFGNIVGWCLSCYYLLEVYAILCGNTRRNMTEMPSEIELSRQKKNWVLGLFLTGHILILLSSYFAFIIYAPAPTDPSPFTERQKNILGITAIILLVLFYSSPLSTLYHVIKTKNASSFQLPLMLTCLVNAFLWTAYGFSIKDGFVSYPNLVGVFVNLLQVACKFMYPSPTPEQYTRV